MQKHRRYMGIKGFKKKTEILLKSMNEVRVNICQKLKSRHNRKRKNMGSFI